MYRAKGIALIPVLIITALIASGLGVYYYKDSISQKISDIRGNSTSEIVSVTPLPSPTPITTPTPTATPVPTPTAKATPGALTSIAEIATQGTSSIANNALPQSGPEDVILLLTGVGSLGGGGYYYMIQQKKYKKSLRNINIS